MEICHTKKQNTRLKYRDLSLNCSLGPTDPPEYPWLYAVPAVVFSGGFIAAASTGAAGLVQAGYLISSMLCIGSISGLASQATARMGNMLGILGVGSGVLASLLAVGFSPEVLAQFAGLATIGALAGQCHLKTPLKTLEQGETQLIMYLLISRNVDWQTDHTN